MASIGCPKINEKDLWNNSNDMKNKCQAIEFRLTSNSYSSEIKQAMKLNDTNTQQLMTQQSKSLRIYDKHHQSCAIDFVDYFLTKFPFRVHTIQTDNGHEFQAKFHWHCGDLGIRHVYIKPGKPNLNGKVERSHLTDDQEFYQLIEYTDDIDITKKLEEWENFYNCHRPNFALKGKTPYEVLRESWFPNNFFPDPLQPKEGVTEQTITYDCQCRLGSHILTVC
jgi:IS30 family transposase